MRVGAFARGLLLKGECSVQLVLMCAGKLGWCSCQSLGWCSCQSLHYEVYVIMTFFHTEKPTLNLFNAIAGRLPAKFEVCPILDHWGLQKIGSSCFSSVHVIGCFSEPVLWGDPCMWVAFPSVELESRRLYYYTKNDPFREIVSTCATMSVSVICNTSSALNKQTGASYCNTSSALNKQTGASY